MKRLALAAAIILLTGLAWATPAAAQDVVSYWNERALAALPAAPPAGRGPTPASIIDVAMVHVAMHDAVQAYDRRFESVHRRHSRSIGLERRRGGQGRARCPRQPLSAAGSDVRGRVHGVRRRPQPGTVGGRRRRGEIVGAVAASNLIANRTNDGSFPTTFDQFTGGTAPGQWQPNAGTPGMVSPWGGDVTPFALDSLARCDVPPPPALTSFEYALHYNEVKLFGSATSRFRTAGQSAIAKTFSGNFLAQYNRLFRELAAAHLAGGSLQRLGQRARLFALTNLSMADAFICAWESKARFNFWRPSQAIRRGNEDGNALTIADPSWTTYFSRNPVAAQDPNYPDYTSGANNLTGAMTQMLALFFGSDKAPRPFGIHATAPAVPLTAGEDPDPRVYTRFSDVSHDVVDARVYLGIHFRFADAEARSQGRRVARYAFRNFLQPID